MRLRHGGYGHSPTYKDAAASALSDATWTAMRMISCGCWRQPVERSCIWTGGVLQPSWNGTAGITQGSLGSFCSRSDDASCQKLREAAQDQPGAALAQTLGHLMVCQRSVGVCVCVCVLQSEADGSQLSLATATTLDVCWCYPMGCHGTYLRMFHVLNVLTAIRGEEFGSVGMSWYDLMSWHRTRFSRVYARITGPSASLAYTILLNT